MSPYFQEHNNRTEKNESEIKEQDHKQWNITQMQRANSNGLEDAISNNECEMAQTKMRY
jgi:hypothetical protein